MRTLLILLIPLVCGGQMMLDPYTTFKTVAGGPSYVISEGFEGVGAPSGWTVDDGSPNWDYTTTVLQGSESLFLGTANDGVGVSFSPVTPIFHGFFATRVAALALGGFTHYFEGSSGIQFYLQLQADGKIAIKDGDHGLRAITASAVISPGTTHYIWVDYDAGSGANAAINLYVATTTTKPSVTLATTTGEGTQDIQQIFFTTSDSTADVLLDYARVDDETIGSAPQ